MKHSHLWCELFWSCNENEDFQSSVVQSCEAIHNLVVNSSYPPMKIQNFQSSIVHNCEKIDTMCDVKTSNPSMKMQSFNLENFHSCENIYTYGVNASDPSTKIQIRVVKKFTHRRKVVGPNHFQSRELYTVVKIFPPWCELWRHQTQEWNTGRFHTHGDKKFAAQCSHPRCKALWH